MTIEQQHELAAQFFSNGFGFGFSLALIGGFLGYIVGITLSHY